METQEEILKCQRCGKLAKPTMRDDPTSDCLFTDIHFHSHSIRAMDNGELLHEQSGWFCEDCYEALSG